MLKKLERSTENSCWNKAKEDEPIFILLGRDIATNCAILEWMKLRILYGKNTKDDPQILEAREFIEKVRDYQIKLAEERSNQHIEPKKSK